MSALLSHFEMRNSKGLSYLSHSLKTTFSYATGTRNWSRIGKRRAPLSVSTKIQEREHHRNVERGHQNVQGKAGACFAIYTGCFFNLTISFLNNSASSKPIRTKFGTLKATFALMAFVIFCAIRLRQVGVPFTQSYTCCNRME